MNLMSGRKGFIFGVANEQSLAWQIAYRLHQHGAELAFNHLPNARFEQRVRQLAEPIGARLIVPCDVADEQQVATALSQAHDVMGPLDFLVHSIAYASREALTNPLYKTSRDDFLEAMHISAYSFVAICRHALPYLSPGASVLCLTYLGAVKVIPGYNVMGVCKAALEAATRYLAAELGREKQIRVNALSAGPVRTLSALAIPGFGRILDHYPSKSPLARNIEPEEVAKAALYLLSDLASGVTGQVHYVDAGYSIIGW